ncbi:MAG: Vi polysaccharide biosynthesis UDP-N-acetylglucosamine C-6 dehydrogenase TviB [Myxococcales bacterium]|nr:Vi polysaccharide biosynthesis UDP-N-acetylglucosamine C-6 dehydrogenase TviB [Myxococcales bacterium]
MIKDPDKATIAVIGLGYVGLPLAVEFGRKLPTIGLDINPQRVAELKAGEDRTKEVEPEELAAARHLRVTASPDDLADCDTFIVTVPTPIDRYKRPDLGPLRAASRTVGAQLSPGDVVVYESTVYPGATEEVCVPILEEASGLTFNQDFFVGYSPERINPGDKKHRLTTITKVTAGSTPEIGEYLAQLYGRIIEAGIHAAPSIRVAEAAKVIENTQRDLNIAIINELSLIFHRLGIDTEAVLEAAGTKWNFLPFRPGLVGGHCIGVDPYYLTHKAQEVGHNPELILAGRRINDSMGQVVASRVVKLMAQRGLPVANARVLVMGLTFKENCPDLRNTRVVDIVAELQGYSAEVDVYDPWVDPEEALHEYGITTRDQPDAGAYHAVVVAVAHEAFRQMGVEQLRRLAVPGGVLFDVKYVLSPEDSDGRL